MAPIPYADKDIHYAYNCIHDFFDTYGLSGSLEDLESILQATLDHKVWKKDAPYLLLFFMEKLESLCTAAFLINDNYATVKEAILQPPGNGEPDLTLQYQFTDRYYNTNLWNNFPRSLTSRQYHDPYRAIKKFCRYMPAHEWKKILKEITEYGLSRDTITESLPPYNILTIRLRLVQLIEACHLLDLRINPKIPAAVNDKE